jgi:hypothetical protein
VAKQWHIEKGADLVPAIFPFFLTAATVQAAKKRYENVTMFSWFTVPNTLKFMQNTFFSKH